MNEAKGTIGLLLAVSALSLSKPAMAQDAASPQAKDASTQASLADLQARIDALQTKVNELQAKSMTAQDVDATVERVLKDANSRSQLFAADDAFTAGYRNGKFQITSGDGRFVFHPWLQMQFREVLDYRQDVPHVGTVTTGGVTRTVIKDTRDDYQDGFEMRRMKFGFDGNLFSPDLTYTFIWGTDRSTGTPGLEEAWLKYRLNDSWGVRAGQFKDPFAHESLISSKKLMAAERTLLTDVFAGGDNYVQGATVFYDAHGPLRAEFGVTDGSNEINRNYQDFPTNKWDFGVAGRVEYLAMGKYTDYDDFSGRNIKNDLLVVGGGIDYSEAGNTDQVLHTADIQFKNTTGLSLYAAYYGRYIKDNPASASVAPAAENDLYDWGVIGQVSVAVGERWEPFLRYDYIRFDAKGLAAGVENEVHEISAGVNYYFHGHDAKLTIDGTYLPNGSPVSDSGADLLSSDNNEIVLRAQFQLLI